MLDHERRHWTLRWEVQAPRLTLEEAMAGVRGFRLNPDRDQELFDLLLEYDALATRHLLFAEFDLFASRVLANQRLVKLWREGFLARTKVSARPGFLGEAEALAEPLETGWEYAWALTGLAFEALVAWDSPTARALKGEWVPPHTSASTRNNVIHQVAVADLVLGLRAYLARTKGVATLWISAKRASHRLDDHGAARRGARGLSPDAVILAFGRDARDLIFVEYEESARPDRIRRGFDAYADYLGQRAWREVFPQCQPPHVLWSFSRHADRQRYWANPFEQAQAILRERPELDRQVFLLCEQEWRAGHWRAHGAHSKAPPAEVADACLTTPLR